MIDYSNKGWLCPICGAPNNPVNRMCAALCWQAAKPDPVIKPPVTMGALTRQTQTLENSVMGGAPPYNVAGAAYKDPLGPF